MSDKSFMFACTEVAAFSKILCVNILLNAQHNATLCLKKLSIFSQNHRKFDFSVFLRAEIRYTVMIEQSWDDIFFTSTVQWFPTVSYWHRGMEIHFQNSSLKISEGIILLSTNGIHTSGYMKPFPRYETSQCLFKWFYGTRRVTSDQGTWQTLLTW